MQRGEPGLSEDGLLPLCILCGRRDCHTRPDVHKSVLFRRVQRILPQPAPLVQGIDGNFYGTTGGGGLYDSCMYGTCGTVFKITAEGTPTTLHSFTGGGDGSGPMPGLALATNGNFYGVNSDGGNYGHGVAFKITAEGSLTTLHSFTGGGDGSGPMPGLALATNGNFYGVNSDGGNYGHGVAFKITAEGSLTTLFAFSDGAEGGNPNSKLIQATNGNLYGTTVIGGTNGDGAIFEVTLAGALTLLHDFDFTDGWGPSERGAG